MYREAVATICRNVSSINPIWRVVIVVMILTTGLWWAMGAVLLRGSLSELIGAPTAGSSSSVFYSGNVSAQSAVSPAIGAAHGQHSIGQRSGSIVTQSAWVSASKSVQAKPREYIDRAGSGWGPETGLARADSGEAVVEEDGVLDEDGALKENDTLEGDGALHANGAPEPAGVLKKDGAPGAGVAREVAGALATGADRVREGVLGERGARVADRQTERGKATEKATDTVAEISSSNKESIFERIRPGKELAADVAARKMKEAVGAQQTKPLTRAVDVQLVDAADCDLPEHILVPVSVQFRRDSYVPRAKSMRELELLVEAHRDCPTAILSISENPLGKVDATEALTQRRFDEVKYYFLQNSVPKGALRYVVTP